MKFIHKVFPGKVDETAKYPLGESIWGTGNAFDFIVLTIITEIISLIVAICSGGGTFWLLVLAVIVAYFVIMKSINVGNDERNTKVTIKLQKEKADLEATFYTQKFNSILQKSEEIVDQILSYYEERARVCVEQAKIEFAEHAYSPFWSEIEEASKFLACYKEALEQLCLNSEVYTCGLENKSHNFPTFPFATNVPVSQTIINEYKIVIRKAQTNPTFSIIWEQRRNSKILIGGFRTLENAINNMGNDLLSALYDLKNSISSELSEMKYVQKEQLKSFETSQAYLNKTLNSMDDKLYYIQWNKKPSDTFYYK